MAGGGESRFLQALDRAQSKKDAGFTNNWSFENLEESEGDVEKDEVNLLNIEESDGVNSKATERKSIQLQPRTLQSPGDSFKTYERRGKALYLRPSKGNATGLNMLGASNKLGENAQNIALPPGTMVQGRIFQHTNITRSVMKTAAQSSLERRERKEYPPHVPKVDDSVRLTQRLEDMQDTRDDSESESEPSIRRKSTEQSDSFQHCTTCVKENKKTRCQSCGDAQRLCRQSTSSSESPASLARPSIHQIVSADKALNAKTFYGSSRITMDSMLKNDSPRWKQYPANGKIGLSTESSLSKITKNARLKSSRLSETNDPIILSSDDEDNVSTGSTSRIESISPRPADSACSSPVPSSGKVEAALRENNLVDKKYSSPPEPDLHVTIPRKARMKDQFGNSVTTTPVKRRKVAQIELPSEPTSMLPCPAKPCESMILVCRNVRIGTFYRQIVEPVVFCVDFIKIVLEAPDAEGLPEELFLKTSELTKCEWCCARKLSLVFYQSTPFLCNKLRLQFKMSKQNGLGWYDCKAANIEEQYIVLIFEKPLNGHEILCFEKIHTDVEKKNLIPQFLSKLVFEEANRRLVAFTNNVQETPSLASTQKDHITRSVISETRMKLRNTTTQLQYFDDSEGDNHSVFIGPIEKLIVYPPPPAKGGISVTNEDLHCLNEGEFLNDVIIDFYLKYLVLEKLRDKAEKIHIFSSFFYKRLNQRERRNLQDTANLTLQQRRHGRVKTWTRHVDIFQKDFIFVPLNEAAHWFLAVICFPGLEKPEYYPNRCYQETNNPSAAMTQTDDNQTSVSSGESQSCLQSGSSKSPLKKLPSKKQTVASSDASSGTEDGDTPVNRRSHCVGRHSLRKNDQGLQESDASLKSPFSQTDSSKNVNGIANECKTPIKHADGLHRIQISYSDSPDDQKKGDEELIDFSDDQDNLDESSDDGGLADDNFTSEAGKWHLKPLFCKQPCILLMDSLRGPSRSTVVKTLREYLEVEWEVKKGSKRSFSKEFMKGSNPRVPQQNNFSDCGVFVLQYVESFFENPIQSFDLPMNLTDWFPQQRMKTKREEIRNLILGLQELQSKDKKGQRDLGITQPTPQEGTEQFIRDFESV
ncbi:LOW QUALITY PROTEIN: sentrin-specific protease 6 [Hyla sarda]|uniref:LOW QUALITY PROTEIN: sentrin-specific protease 6 n=1 Tax=Hyla sarda TaxID=327740 RepID=UPI0024C2281B|nr:LOW QUALITY PROTEIN: sentrin-specific protease 6 [Hyla sarda]